jgi:hypothetical protein
MMEMVHCSNSSASGCHLDEIHVYWLLHWLPRLMTLGERTI